MDLEPDPVSDALDRMTNRLEAVKRLHQPNPNLKVNKICANCSGTWPCATYLAATGRQGA